jgi:hypothetical protein
MIVSATHVRHVLADRYIQCLVKRLDYGVVNGRQITWRLAAIAQRLIEWMRLELMPRLQRLQERRIEFVEAVEALRNRQSVRTNEALQVDDVAVAF